MDGRGNKNDINPNTHSSMNILMQNAKTCTILLPNPMPKHNCVQPYPYERKTQKKERRKTPKYYHRYFIIQHGSAVVGSTLTCAYIGHNDKKARCKIARIPDQMA